MPQQQQHASPSYAHTNYKPFCRWLYLQHQEHPVCYVALVPGPRRIYRVSQKSDRNDHPCCHLADDRILERKKHDLPARRHEDSEMALMALFLMSAERNISCIEETSRSHSSLATMDLSAGNTKKCILTKSEEWGRGF
jgi:hypothetical protein